MYFMTAVTKLEAAGFSREQAMALVDVISECARLPEDQMLSTPQQTEALMDGRAELKEAVKMKSLQPKPELPSDLGLPPYPYMGGAKINFMSHIKPLKAVIIWSVFVQIVMGCLTYHYRYYVRTGLDFLIVIGLWGNVFGGGILFLELLSRRRVHQNVER